MGVTARIEGDKLIIELPLNTKDPQPEFAADARATYGAYDSYRFQPDVTGPILT